MDWLQLRFGRDEANDIKVNHRLNYQVYPQGKIPENMRVPKPQGMQQNFTAEQTKGHDCKREKTIGGVFSQKQDDAGYHTLYDANNDDQVKKCNSRIQ